MKDKKNDIYMKLGMTGAVVLFFSLIVFFFLYRIDHFSKAISMIIGILRPFLYGIAIAYIIKPMCAWFERMFTRLFGQKRQSLAKALAIGCSIIIALLIVLNVFLLIVPQLVSSIAKIVKDLPANLEQLKKDIPHWLENFPILKDYWKNDLQAPSEELFARIDAFVADKFGSGNLSSTIGSLASGILSGVVGLADLLIDLFIGVIVSIYLLAKRRRLAAQASLIIHGFFKPSWASWIMDEARFADHIFNGFFIGKLIDSLIVGIISYAGCLFMKISSPLLISVIIGVTNIIPFFGPYIGAVPSALLVLLEDPVKCLIFLIFIILLQQLDGNVIGPKILGDATGLSSLWVMFGILLFGGLWGIIGMLIGVPLMAVLYDIVRQITIHHIRKRNKEDLLTEYNQRFHSSK